jgi:ABC-2 type transport system permease protein
MDVSFGELMLPIVSLMVEIMLFGVLALFLSLLFPSRRLAAMVAGILLVASFFITGLAGIISELEGVARFSPLNYYQGGDAMSGLNLEWLAGLIGAMAFFTLLSWWLFKRREIRVGGEGTWTLPIPILRMVHRRGKETTGGS